MSLLEWHFQPDGNGEIIATPTNGPSVSLQVRFEDFQRIVVNDLHDIFHRKTVEDGDASHGSIDLGDPTQIAVADPVTEPASDAATAAPTTVSQEQPVGQTDTPSA